MDIENIIFITLGICLILIFLAYLFLNDKKLNPQDFIKEVWEEYCRQAEYLAMLRIGINPDNQKELENNNVQYQ